MEKPPTNPFNLPRRHTVKVVFNGGAIITTEINGTTDSVVVYYIGNWFNVGSGELDDMQKAVTISFWDGECWMMHKKTAKCEMQRSA